jgi:hypothetical protein
MTYMTGEGVALPEGGAVKRLRKMFGSLLKSR